ncbi:alpha/beta hydrolase [Candidatus Thioglobus sp.]|nr:alpha/beta hydrolase [Candidatus Thioglobus sp.]
MININSLDKLIEDSENEILNIRPDTEKKIIWANQNKVKTKISLIFIHGFSATRAELDPVIEMLGKELSANTFFTRLRGHGLDGEALAEASFDDWMMDMKEAIEIGNIIGDKLILIGCSTGCSLIHANLQYINNAPAVIYISPNFGSKSYLGKLLIIPGAKWFIPFIFGNEYSFVPRNADHARCWTTSYPIRALFAVKDSVVAAYKVKHIKIKQPVLFWFSDDDQVVSAKATRKIISKMGNNVSIHNPILTNTDDSSKHGILGDILSSSQTNSGVKKILSWLENYI